MIEWSDQKVEESEVGWVSPDLKMYKFRFFFRRFFVHPMMAIFGVFGDFGDFGHFGVFFLLSWVRVARQTLFVF